MDNPQSVKIFIKKGFGQHNVIVIGSGENQDLYTEKLLIIVKGYIML